MALDSWEEQSVKYQAAHQYDFPNTPSYQSGIGEPVKASNANDMSWNRGYLALAEVTWVNPKRNTANIRVFRTEDKVESKDALEGENAAVIGVGSAGFDNVFQVPYGEIMPLRRGNVVLVGFLKNSSDKPIIIRVLHETVESIGSTNFRNILPGSHDPESNVGDITTYLHVSPIQDFKRIDRFGNIELASHTKSFFVARNMLDDEHFDYEDLSVKYPFNKTVVNPLAHYSDSADNYHQFDDQTSDTTLEVGTIHVQEKWSQPKKWMAVFRDKFVDSLTNWLRVIVDAGKTSLRILKQQRQTFSQGSSLMDLDKSGAVTAAEIDAEGAVKLRRQMDTRILTDNTIPKTDENPTQSPSQEFTDIQMLANGGILIQAVDKTQTVSSDGSGSGGGDGGGGATTSTSDDDGSDTTYPHTLIYIAPKGGGITVETTSQLLISAKRGIAMQTEESITMQAKKSITMMCQETSDSSTAFQMTSEGTAAMSAKTGGDNGTTAGLSLSGKDNGSAAVSTTNGDTQAVVSLGSGDGGAATMMTTDGNSSASTSMAGSGTVTTSTPGGSTEWSGSKITQLGKFKSMGDANYMGNSKFTGGHKVNGRGAVLKGDPDSHGYTNKALFANALVQIAESFVVSKATEMVTAKLPGLAAISGIVNIAMQGYRDVVAASSMGWDGAATSMETALKGVVVDPNGPFAQKFNEFVGDKLGGAVSVSNAMDFITSPDGLNIDLESLANEAADMEPLAGTVFTTTEMYNKFGAKNAIGDLVDSGTGIMSTVTTGMALTFEPQNVTSLAMRTVMDNVEVQFDAGALNSEIGEIGDPTDWLSDALNVEGLIQPGSTKTETTGGGGGQGGGAQHTTITTYTIADAVTEMSQYAPNISEQWTAACQAYDAAHGTNTAAYVGWNEKITQTTGGNSAGGSGGTGGSGNTTTTIKPKPYPDQDAYAAAQIGATVLSTFKRGAKTINEAYKVNVSSQEIPDTLTPDQNAKQAQNINAIKGGNPDNAQQENAGEGDQAADGNG